MKKYIIIVAGGSGKRMNAAIPKQFINLKGMPVLMHTFQRFSTVLPNTPIILVLPEKDIPIWKDLCKAHAFNVPHQICAGGEERFHSVKNGLALLPDDGVVAIHDGVRPFPSEKTIRDAFSSAEKLGSGIPCIALTESLRKIENNHSYGVARDTFKCVQTPQCFQIPLLKKSYHQMYSILFTDDASVFEHDGNSVFLTEGNRENIKITTPLDLMFSEIMLSQE